MLCALSRFIAHDVTTSLRFGRLNLKSLERAVESGSTEAVYNQIESLRARLDVAELVLERVKDFGIASEIDTCPTPLDLPLLAQQLEPLAGSRDFGFDWDGPPLQIVTARDPLRLALAELVRNAVDHHDQPTGTVRLEWSDQGEQLAFRVSDDGPGIPDDKRDRLFRFGGTIGPRNTRQHAGLGLSIVAHLARVLNQQCVIAPNPRGSRGTTVLLTWPTHWPFDHAP